MAPEQLETSANGGPPRGHFFIGRGFLRNADRPIAARQIRPAVKQGADGRPAGRGRSPRPRRRSGASLPTRRRSQNRDSHHHLHPGRARLCRAPTRSRPARGHTSRFGIGMSQSAPSPAGSPHSQSQIFSWLALGCFILAVRLGGFMGIDPTHGSALACAGLGLTLALVCGIISWHERVGRVVAIVVVCLTAAAAITLAIGWSVSCSSLEIRTSSRHQTCRPRHRCNPTQSVSTALTHPRLPATLWNMPSIKPGPNWRHVRFLARSGGVFGIHARGTDLAALVNKATIGAPMLPEGSLNVTASPQELADILKNTVVEVVLYRDDLAGVITFPPSTNQFITECLARQNGQWKIYLLDGLDFTLTKEAAVKQFENEAGSLRRESMRSPPIPRLTCLHPPGKCPTALSRSPVRSAGDATASRKHDHPSRPTNVLKHIRRASPTGSFRRRGPALPAAAVPSP